MSDIRKFVPAPERETRKLTVLELQQRALERLKAGGETEAGQRELMAHQEDFVGRFIDYFSEVVARREAGTDQPGPRMARIVSAPRTGKTTMAAEILRRTDLPGAFLAPTSNLVEQAAREFEILLPDKKIVKYTGKEKGPLEAGDVIVATYQIGQTEARTKGEIPPPLRDRPIVFADEGHESTTEKRMALMREQFAPHTIRVALTGTPDYSERRKLEHFYPDLIHTMTTPEAVKLGLLSPFQYWIYEIDLDGSKVQLEGGDYDAAQIGRLITGLPIFKMMEQIRFSAGNKDTPALITFRTKQQASDAAAYLNRVKPAGAKAIAAVTEDTANRQSVLDGYENGDYDTLITVKVLTKGWDSPRCKLHVDFDPTVSPVSAGQKFTRALTKSGVVGERVAQIYAIVPSKLRYPPLLPPDVLLDSDVPLPPGQVIGKITEPTPRTAKPMLALPEKIENVPVRLLFNARDYGGLKAISLDRNNRTLLRAIVMSGFASILAEERAGAEEPSEEEAQATADNETALVELLHSYRNFQNTFFQHPAFTGFGRVLLWSLGIKDKDGFEEFVNANFPEQAAAMLLMRESLGKFSLLYRDRRQQAAREIMSEPSVAADAAKLIDRLYQGGKLDEVQGGLRALFGPYTDREREPEGRPDPFLLKVIFEALQKMRPTNRRALLERVVNGRTLEEIGEQMGVSHERTRQIVNQAIQNIRNYLQKWRPRIFAEQQMTEAEDGKMGIHKRQTLKGKLAPYFAAILKPASRMQAGMLADTVADMIAVENLSEPVKRYLYAKIVQARHSDEIRFVEGLSNEDVTKGEEIIKSVLEALHKQEWRSG